MGRREVPANLPTSSVSVPSERTQKTRAGDVSAYFLKVGRMSKLARGQREVFVKTL